MITECIYTKTRETPSFEYLEPLWFKTFVDVAWQFNKANQKPFKFLLSDIFNDKDWKEILLAVLTSVWLRLDWEDWKETDLPLLQFLWSSGFHFLSGNMLNISLCVRAAEKRANKRDTQLLINTRRNQRVELLIVLETCVDMGVLLRRFITCCQAENWLLVFSSYHCFRFMFLVNGS